MNNLLDKWMQQTTSAQQSELARIACTSRGYLYQIAVGERRVSTKLAARLEKAAEMLHQTEGTPLLPRHLVSENCGNCRYAPKF